LVVENLVEVGGAQRTFTKAVLCIIPVSISPAKAVLDDTVFLTFLVSG
jgi:hypothetical protein